MTQAQSKQEWQALIKQYEASGKKNQSGWCREHGINLRKFNRWYNKIKKQASSTTAVQGWIPIQIAEKAESLPLDLKIGKVNIEVREGFEPTLLVQVVKVLVEIC